MRSGPASEPVGLERLWAGWRSAYVGEAAAGDDGCVFCRILASEEPGERTHVLWRGRRCAALLNAYPYTNGHLMVLPVRHVADLEDLDADEAGELWPAVTAAVVAIKAAYGPDGLNLGMNLGRSAGAGVPGHVHVHAMPRWDGDTNFMTTVANTRVMPETLEASWQKLVALWPATT